MDIVQTLKALFDLGGVVVVTFMLWVVWRRLETLTDRLIDILTELRDERLISRLPGADDINKH